MLFKRIYMYIFENVDIQIILFNHVSKTVKSIVKVD